MAKPDLPYNPNAMRVMIIDEHDPMRKALRRILSGMGFASVVECLDGSDALKILAKTQVDLVITEIFMRKVDGFAVLKKIRSQDLGSDIPVIVVTGEASRDDIVKAANLGADEYVLKPFQMADITKKVTAVLTKYHSPPPLLRLLREGDKLALQGHHHDALKQYEAAERLDPKSPRAKFSKALMINALGQSLEALKILQESSHENPTYNKNFAAMADIYLHKNDTRAGINALKSELELNSKQVDRQILLANLLLNEGLFDEAILHFRTALLEDPKYKEALLGSGKAYEQSGNSEKAIYYYRRARRQHPKLTQALRMMVGVYERDKNLKGAIFELLDEINKNPTRHDARIVLAELHEKNDDLESAIKTIEEGLSRDNKSSVLLKGMAKLLINSGKIPDACEIMRQVLEIDGSESNILMYAETLMSDNRTLEAYQTLHRALEKPNDRQKVLVRLSESMKRLGYFAQAITTLEMALKAGGLTPEKIMKDDIKSMMPSVVNRRAGLGLKKIG